MSAEIVIEPGEEELLDSRLSVRFVDAARPRGPGWSTPDQTSDGIDPKPIIGQNPVGQTGISISCCRCDTSNMPVIECVPNVSEGRRTEVVNALVDAVRHMPSVRLLDHSSDTAHNRSVITMAGEAGPLKGRALRSSKPPLPQSISATHGRTSPPWRGRRRAVHPDRG